MQTFKKLRLVDKAGEKGFYWGGRRKKYYFTKSYSVLDGFVEHFLEFSLEHPRPSCGCSLAEISDYSILLGRCLRNVLRLKSTHFDKYVRPHAFRQIFMRCEEVTREPSISQYYQNLTSNMSSDDDRTTFWRSQGLDDLRLMAPGSNEYLNEYLLGVPPSANSKYNLDDLARRFRMHPLLVPWWTGLVVKAISDYGVVTTRTVLRDGNRNTQEVLAQYLERWGADLTPPMSRLMRLCCPGKRVRARSS